MVIRPDPKNIIKQLIQVQNFDLKRAIKEQRTQPFDFFLKKTQKPLPPHLQQQQQQINNSNNQITNSKLYGFDEAFKIVTSYLFTPTPIYLNLKLNWPKNNYNFVKVNRLPVDPKIIPESKSPVVMVFAEGTDAENCKKAGADYVGGIKLLQQIQKYGMIPVDDCFCEMKQLPGVIKMAPFLGKYTPSVKRSTAYDNIAPFIHIYKQWNYLTFMPTIASDDHSSPSSNNDKEDNDDKTDDNLSSSKDIFDDRLMVRLANSNQEKELFKQQLSHVVAQIRSCATPPPPETSIDTTELQQPMIGHCELSAKNAPTIRFNPLLDF